MYGIGDMMGWKHIGVCREGKIWGPRIDEHSIYDINDETMWFPSKSL
jgi:hypothetical protein